MQWRNHRSTAKGLAAGAIGGLAATWIMGYAQTAFHKVAGELAHAGGNGSPAPQRPHMPAAEDEPATVKAAVAIARAAGRDLAPERREAAGSLVHYAYGTLIGAAYGAAAEHSDLPRTASGAAFGSALWLLADEVAVPALKLARPARDYPAEVHAVALCSHLAYSVTTELIRRALRAGVLAR